MNECIPELVYEIIEYLDILSIVAFERTKKTNDQNKILFVNRKKYLQTHNTLHAFHKYITFSRYLRIEDMLNQEHYIDLDLQRICSEIIQCKEVIRSNNDLIQFMNILIENFITYKSNNSYDIFYARALREGHICSCLLHFHDILHPKTIECLKNVETIMYVESLI